jgi:hypothetical protein
VPSVLEVADRFVVAVVRDSERQIGVTKNPAGPALLTFEVDQSRVGRLETAGAEVEPTQVVLEVDMEPLTTGRLGPLCGHGYKFGAHVATLVRACDDRVQDESMAGPVPHDVQEADSSRSSRAQTHPRL